MILPPTIPLSELPFCAIAGALTNTSPAIPAKVVIGDRVIVCLPRCGNHTYNLLTEYGPDKAVPRG